MIVAVVRFSSRSLVGESVQGIKGVREEVNANAKQLDMNPFTFALKERSYSVEIFVSLTRATRGVLCAGAYMRSRDMRSPPLYFMHGGEGLSNSPLQYSTVRVSVSNLI